MNVLQISKFPNSGQEFSVLSDSKGESGLDGNEIGSDQSLGRGLQSNSPGLSSPRQPATPLFLPSPAAAGCEGGWWGKRRRKRIRYNQDSCVRQVRLYQWASSAKAQDLVPRSTELKIPNNFIFEFVFCKQGPKEQRGMHMTRGDTHTMCVCDSLPCHRHMYY